MKYPMPVIQTLMCKYKSSEISGLFYYHQTIEFHNKKKRFTLNKKDSYQAKKIHTKQKIFILDYAKYKALLEQHNIFCLCF